MRTDYTRQIQMTVTPDEESQIIEDAKRNGVSVSNQLRMAYGLPPKQSGRRPRTRQKGAAA